jgi:hypothetical protein
MDRLAKIELYLKLNELLRVYNRGSHNNSYNHVSIGFINELRCVTINSIDHNTIAKIELLASLMNVTVKELSR